MRVDQTGLTRGVRVPSVKPMVQARAETAPDTSVDGLRVMTFGMVVLLLVQMGIGMVVNLFVGIPDAHPGAHPANYFSGSASSVAWAITQPQSVLTAHVVLGLALIVTSIAIAVRAVQIGGATVGVTAVIGALLVIGAAFNGASFLDFSTNDSSLIMALLALAAVLCYALVLLALPTRPTSENT